MSKLVNASDREIAGENVALQGYNQSRGAFANEQLIITQGYGGFLGVVLGTILRTGTQDSLSRGAAGDILTKSGGRG